ncbi:unnamed protein product, partial [Effrenium voratum]
QQHVRLMPREEMAASDALVAKMLESWLGLGPDIKQADLVAGMDEMPASSDTDETVKERMSSMNKALLAATLPVLEETGFVWAVSDFEKCILAMFKDLVGPKLSNKKFTRSPKGPLAGEDDAEARNEPEQTDKRVGGNDEGEAGPVADKAEVCNAPEQTDKRVGGFDEDEAGPDADQAEIGGDAHEEEDSVESVEVDADGLGPARPHEGRQKGIAEGGPANLEASDGTAKPGGDMKADGVAEPGPARVKKERKAPNGPLWDAYAEFRRKALEHGIKAIAAAKLWKQSAVRATLLESISDSEKKRRRY